ncbi:hypothetical protein PFLUV_G00238380 [Perca fluviatilis]|uniref:Uncharacterized protein n=1 Tax=Perca fluviatilis TaxID=8168 RepID=A0A6A5EH57_PERFL|nr:hypothetical protein PFLUV_G00238380 [Perca fluviatilis]
MSTSSAFTASTVPREDGQVEPHKALLSAVDACWSTVVQPLQSSDLLLQPNISVSSMDGVSEAQQQGFQVFRGSTFNISCSIQPQYPGGSFQLTFTSSNSTHNSTQPAVNHSAHFLFPAAEPAHQGTYSCVYHLYVFSHNFSSESCLLSLTVSGKKTVYRFGEDDWSKLSENDQLSTCF